MKYIYYPYIDITNEEWVKFALLYLDEIIPIHPAQLYDFESGYELSDTFKKITQETDLIRRHYISENDHIVKDKTSNTVVETLESIIANPKEYKDIFHSDNFIERWQNERFQNFNLYRDKYTEDFLSFCENNKLCRYGEEGTFVPNEVGVLYMSVLAHDLGEQNDVSAITDNNLIDTMSMKLRATFPSTDRETASEPPKNSTLTVAKKIINIKLPNNLHSISIDKIIQFREKTNFKRNLHSFHTSLNRALTLAENSSDPHEVLSKFNGEHRDLMLEISALGLTAVSVGLGVWIAVQAPEMTSLEVVKEAAGIGGLSGLLTIKSKWNNEAVNSRYTRKYLSDLSGLKK
ncbi:hypothetical protein M3204_23440 [Mesobacillus subterraneus]|uniref:hypothetical protein n=1 Tax=Mesobacillus subterraneus TaxID=285983 RepID=UPI00204123CD|nr:hypothetical protein [Mesobacillus subterraneus]MCM3667332.1 hypothetical protein [Mesobacillus subterraneus]MCM3686323.1 hypothetical protein [Mesobacillus subterraneus]